MNKNIRTIKLYPFYNAFSADLVFYISVDTLFLTYIKNLNASQISFMSMFGLLMCIIFQKPVLKIAKKIGNCNSVRLGTFLLLVSTCVLTFSKTFYGLLIHRLLTELSFMFTSMVAIIIQNNLKKLTRTNEFVEIINRGKLYYGILTLFTTLIGGYLYNINNYLPLYFSIGLLVIVTAMSFLFVDEEYSQDISQESKEETKFKMPKHLIYAFLSSALYVAIFRIGQSNSKLFMQYDFLETLSYEKVTTYLTYIVFFSRIARILGNLFFTKIYHLLDVKVGNIFSISLFASFALQVLGHYINVFFIKVILLSIGYIIILTIRDPFQTYIDDVELKNTPRNYRQQVIVNNEVYRKISQLIIYISFTLILTKYELVVTQIILTILSLIEIFINYRMISLIKKVND